MAVGAVVAVVGLIIVVGVASGHGSGSGGCRGGADKMDGLAVTYQSTDGTHWTATYPCWKGGSTTVPVARRQVPGGGR